MIDRAQAIDQYTAPRSALAGPPPTANCTTRAATPATNKNYPSCSPTPPLVLKMTGRGSVAPPALQVNQRHSAHYLESP
jgi:hypothetical protein